MPRFDHADPQPSCDGAERISRRLGRQTPGPRAPHKARRCRRDAERDANDASERHNRLQFWKSDQTCPFSYVDRQGRLGKLKRAEKILSGTSGSFNIRPNANTFWSHFSLFSDKQELFLLTKYFHPSLIRPCCSIGSLAYPKKEVFKKFNIITRKCKQRQSEFDNIGSNTNIFVKCKETLVS